MAAVVGTPMNRVTASLGSVIFLIIAPGFLAGFVPWWMSRWRWQSTPSALDIAGLKLSGAAFIVLGLVVLLDSYARFALQGIGTPAPLLPTRHLVATGFYRHVRNPIYVAVTALVVGQGLLFARIGILLWLFVHIFVISYEEPTLRRTFGACSSATGPTFPEGCRGYARGPNNLNAGLTNPPAPLGALSSWHDGS